MTPTGNVWCALLLKPAITHLFTSMMSKGHVTQWDNLSWITRIQTREVLITGWENVHYRRSHLGHVWVREKVINFSRITFEWANMHNRKCAGRFLADTQMFITVALVLKVFNIKPPPGASAAKPAYEDLFTCRLERWRWDFSYRIDAVSDDRDSHAIPFECSITPRGETEMALIRNEVT